MHSTKAQGEALAECRCSKNMTTVRAGTLEKDSGGALSRRRVLSPQLGLCGSHAPWHHLCWSMPPLLQAQCTMRSFTPAALSSSTELGAMPSCPPSFPISNSMAG